MKSNRAAQSSVDISNLSVPDAEEIIEEALSELAFSQDPGLARALRFLAPPGYQAIVELCSENGRSKRRNAPADSWSPEDDEVRIYFERLDDNAAPARQSRGSRAPIEHNFEEDEEESAVVPADLDARVKELCAALAEAERGGHAFIALKWFRDSFLTAKGVPLEPASGIKTGCAGRGNSERRRIDEQNRQSEDAGVSHDHDSFKPRRGWHTRRGPALPSPCDTGRIHR